MSSQDAKPTKPSGEPLPPFANSLSPAEDRDEIFKHVRQAISAERNAHPSRVNRRNIVAEVQRCAHGPNVGCVVASPLHDSNGATRVLRKVFPDQERGRDQEFRVFGTHNKDSIMHIVGDPPSNLDGYVEREPVSWCIPPSSSRPCNAVYQARGIPSYTRNGSRVSRTGPAPEPNEDIYNTPLQLLASTHSSPTNFLIVLPPPVNLVRRYAPHSVRLDVKFVNHATPVIHSTSVTFINNNTTPPAWLNPSPLRPSSLTTIPESGPIRPSDGVGGDNFSTTAPQEILIFSPHDMRRAQRLSTVSDESSDSGSNSEDFFTPNTSPETFTTSAFIPQSITHRPVPPSSSPTFISSPDFHLLRSPASIYSSAPSSGPYVPQYYRTVRKYGQCSR